MFHFPNNLVIRYSHVLTHKRRPVFFFWSPTTPQVFCWVRFSFLRGGLQAFWTTFWEFRQRWSWCGAVHASCMEKFYALKGWDFFFSPWNSDRWHTQMSRMYGLFFNYKPPPKLSKCIGKYAIRWAFGIPIEIMWETKDYQRRIISSCCSVHSYDCVSTSSMYIYIYIMIILYICIRVCLDFAIHIQIYIYIQDLGKQNIQFFFFRGYLVTQIFPLKRCQGYWSSMAYQSMASYAWSIPSWPVISVPAARLMKDDMLQGFRRWWIHTCRCFWYVYIQHKYIYIHMLTKSTRFAYTT